MSSLRCLLSHRWRLKSLNQANIRWFLSCLRIQSSKCIEPRTKVFRFSTTIQRYSTIEVIFRLQHCTLISLSIRVVLCMPHLRHIKMYGTQACSTLRQFMQRLEVTSFQLMLWVRKPESTIKSLSHQIQPSTISQWWALNKWVPILSIRWIGQEVISFWVLSKMKIPWMLWTHLNKWFTIELIRATGMRLMKHLLPKPISRSQPCQQAKNSTKNFSRPIFHKTT